MLKERTWPIAKPRLRYDDVLMKDFRDFIIDHNSLPHACIVQVLWHDKLYDRARCQIEKVKIKNGTFFYKLTGFFLA